MTFEADSALPFRLSLGEVGHLSVVFIELVFKPQDMAPLGDTLSTEKWPYAAQEPLEPHSHMVEQANPTCKKIYESSLPSILGPPP